MDVTTAAKIIRDGNPREKIWLQILSTQWRHCIYWSRQSVDSSSSRNIPQNYCFIRSEAEQHWACYCTIISAKISDGIEMAFGSKWLINELSRLGFSIDQPWWSGEVQAVCYPEWNTRKFAVRVHSWYIYIADNVDHNVVSLDGQGTFHGMGIIAVSSPKDAHTRPRIIQRLPRITVNEVLKDKGLPIIQYIGPAEKALASITYKPILHLQAPICTIYFTTRNKLGSPLACWMVS